MDFWPKWHCSWILKESVSLISTTYRQRKIPSGRGKTALLHSRKQMITMCPILTDVLSFQRAKSVRRLPTCYLVVGASSQQEAIMTYSRASHDSGTCTSLLISLNRLHFDYWATLFFLFHHYYSWMLDSQQTDNFFPLYSNAVAVWHQWSQMMRLTLPYILAFARAALY